MAIFKEWFVVQSLYITIENKIRAANENQIVENGPISSKYRTCLKS